MAGPTHGTWPGVTCSTYRHRPLWMLMSVLRAFRITQFHYAPVRFVYPDDGSSRIFRNVGTLLPRRATSCPTKA